MDFFKYLIAGVIFSASLYVGFNTPYWLGINDVHIMIVKDK